MSNLSNATHELQETISRNHPTLDDVRDYCNSITNTYNIYYDIDVKQSLLRKQVIITLMDDSDIDTLTFKLKHDIVCL